VAGAAPALHRLPFAGGLLELEKGSKSRKPPR
jgi:hypothetical protein